MTGATARLDRMLAVGRLQRIPPSPSQGRRLLTRAETHLVSARTLAEVDPEGAYALAYDAARKALVGLLEAEGFRPTLKGGHVVVLEAAMALLGDTATTRLQPFDRIRRRRHAAEYPSRNLPLLTPQDVEDDAARVERILALVEAALETSTARGRSARDDEERA